MCGSLNSAVSSKGYYSLRRSLCLPFSTCCSEKHRPVNLYPTDSIALRWQERDCGEAHKKANCVIGAEEVPTQFQGQTVMKTVNGPLCLFPDPNPHTVFIWCILLGLGHRTRGLKIAERAIRPCVHWRGSARAGGSLGSGGSVFIYSWRELVCERGRGN